MKHYKIRKGSPLWACQRAVLILCAAGAIVMMGLSEAPDAVEANAAALEAPGKVVSVRYIPAAKPEKAEKVETAEKAQNRPVEAETVRDDKVIPLKAEKSVAPVVAAEPEPVEAPDAREYLGRYTITAYCACEICCGAYALNRPNGIVYTASGAEAEDGVTVAADWSVLPPGTVIEVEGLGRRVVQDKPADWVCERYGGKIIDVYFGDHDAALAYGKHVVDVWRVTE